MLARIQNDLFDLGADLCRPGDDVERPRSACASPTARSSGWSARSTRMNAELQPLTSFVLPGGIAGRAPTCIWRAPWPAAAERLVCELAEAEPVNPAALRYLNRLSDHLFVLSRGSTAGCGDVLWVPGANR